MAFERLKGAAKGAVKGASDAKRAVTAEQLTEAVWAAVRDVKAEEGRGNSGDIDAIVEKAVAKVFESKKDQKSSSKAPGESQQPICPVELERFMTDPAHTWIKPDLKTQFNELMGRKYELIKDFKDLLKTVQDTYPV